MVFAMIFSVGILVTSIITFASFPSMKDDITYSKCSLYIVLNTALNGDQTRNWGGFTQLKDHVGNISTLLSTASTQFTSTLDGNDWLYNDMQVLKQINNNIYKDNKDSLLIAPNPSLIYTAKTGGTAMPTRQSLFIEKSLGGGPNTMVYDIELGINTTKILSDQGYLVYQSAALLSQSAATIKANTIASQKTLDQFSNQL
jgi:hypothetical protein